MVVWTCLETQKKNKNKKRKKKEKEGTKEASKALMLPCQLGVNSS